MTADTMNTADGPADWVIVPIVTASSEATMHVYSRVAVVIVSLILLQGMFYWHLKLKCVKNRRSRLPSYFHKTFVTFRSLNLLFLGSFVLLSVFVLPGSNAGTDWVFVTWGLFALAVLEHINYYHYQLMHDNAQDMVYLWRHRRLRRSSLALDLIAARTGKEK